MLALEESLERLAELFRRQPVADLATLSTALQTESRMTVFRRLRAAGYLSSCSHAGRYYTLNDIPQFDGDGLWFHQGILFSKHGTLKATVATLVEVAEDGRTHPELHVRLCVRVQNTLLDLVEEQRIARETLDRQYLYVSADRARASMQIARRRERGGQPPPSPGGLPVSAVIEILLEVIHASRPRLDAGVIVQRLHARGVSVTVGQVDEVFARYMLKKTAPSRSPPSRD